MMENGHESQAIFARFLAATHKDKTFFTAEDAEETPHAFPLRPLR
jgi:hypothetical protein